METSTLFEELVQAGILRVCMVETPYRFCYAGTTFDSIN